MWSSGMSIFKYGGVLHLGTLLGTNAAGWFWYPSAGLETTSSCLKVF